jgi:NADH-quinone oxidoreductase subunit H
MSPMAYDLLVTTVKLVVALGFLLNVVPVMVWVERRGSAFMQDRPGPNRLGPLGLIQPLADVVKFMFKEDITPAAADRFLFLMAPVLGVLPALATFSVVPMGPDVVLNGHRIPFVVAPASTGVLLFLALASLGVYSVVMAGYASNNKFSLLGAIRASAQMISYELAMTLAVVAIVIPVSSFELNDIVAYQRTHLWNFIPQFVGFVVFVIAAFAETNRVPFDLPEAESELVAGFHTEYSAMRFATFFMSEYLAMTSLSALGVTLFMGGWSLPGLDFNEIGRHATNVLGLDLHAWVGPALGFAVLIAKVVACLLVYVWVRWTFPRFRYDQLMRLGWKVLLPLSIANLIWSAVGTLAGWL